MSSCHCSQGLRRYQPCLESFFEAVGILQAFRLFKLRVDKLNVVAIHNVAILDPDFRLTSDTLDILSLTSGFVPTPCDDLHPQIARQTRDLVRKLQWRLCFNFSTNRPRFKIACSSRWPSEKCIPPHVSRLSKKILSGTRRLLSKPHRCHFPSNLTPGQAAEVSRLSTCSSTITTADKGGRWTVVPASSYVAEARRQLSNATFYRPIDGPLTNVRSQITHLLQYLLNRKFLTRKEYMHFCPKPETKDSRNFRLLPKLHKKFWSDPHMPPSRPIVSDSGSISRNVADLIDFFLKPLCAMLPSHLRDSSHFIAILRQTSISHSTLLFTLDVESLYTCIPIEDGIQAVSRAFLQNPDPSRPDLTLLSLLRLTLSTNNFCFDDQEWLQIHGVAMGKAYGGSFANLFLGQWEKQALSSFESTTNLWVRFQDDIFGLWEHGADSLILFVEHLNRQHPSIRVTLRYGTSIDFLDLHVTAHNCALQHSVFFKDTDGHLVLPPSSHHPPSTFKGLLYGEILRFASHSSSRQDFEASLRVVTPVWRAQGYSRISIRHAKAAVLSSTHQVSSWETGMFPCSKPQCPTCPYANFINIFSDFKSFLSFPIFHNLSCDSSCVIYIIECSSCSKRYVGQTSRTVRTRILQHLSCIRNSYPSVLYDHFRVCGIHNFSFYAISRHTNDTTRLSKEASWISTLNTVHPHGLNSVAESLQQPINFVLPYDACSVRLANTIKQWCSHVAPVRVSYRRSRNLREHLSRRLDKSAA